MAVPYHQPCYQLVCKMVGTDELDKEVFYDTLKSLCFEHSYARNLDIDYGPVADFLDQYWITQRGAEYVVFSPLSIPELNAYLDALPVVNKEAEATREARQPNPSDPFYRLSPESRLQILSHIDMPSVCRLQVASRAIYDLELRSSFWRSQLLRDMPWLFDLSQISRGDQKHSVDWARVYKDLHLASRKTSKTAIQGLVNRRRIWETTLPQITRPYVERATAESANERAPVTLDGATSTKASRLVLPEPPKTHRTTYPLIREFSEVSSAQLVLNVKWDDDDQLSELRVHDQGSQQAPASNPGASNIDTVVIPDDDWLTGLIITTRENPRETKEDPLVRKIIGLEVMFAKHDPVSVGIVEGDKRLVHVSKGHFVVGINTVSALEGHISRLSFLQQPYDKAYNVDRLRNVNGNGDAQDDDTDDGDTPATARLWRREIPPLPVCASDDNTGYWSWDMQPDLMAMEALVFGTSEEELADITSLSADMQFGGLVVTYGNRPSRSIGPRIQALTTLEIDGAGGERLIAMNAVVGHIPCVLRFVTNRGRQLVLGHHGGNKREHPPALDSGAIPTLVGVYGWWNARQLPQAVLNGVGSLYLPAVAFASASDLPAEHRDSNNLYWNTCSPPASLVEYGRVWGQHETHNKFSDRVTYTPSKSSIVCWLDCTRPVAMVRTTFCHSTRDAQIPLCRVSLAYADGSQEEKSAGPDVWPSPPSDTKGANGHHWCWCEYGHKNDKVKAEMQASPHFTHETWDVGGKQLQSARLWLSESDSLVAMQFTAEGGAESPIWTRETESLGEPSGEVAFSGMGGEAFGLKFFFDGNNRSVSRDDSIVVAVQAMKKA